MPITLYTVPETNHHAHTHTYTLLAESALGGKHRSVFRNATKMISEIFKSAFQINNVENLVHMLLEPQKHYKKLA